RARDVLIGHVGHRGPRGFLEILQADGGWRCGWRRGGSRGSSAAVSRERRVRLAGRRRSEARGGEAGGREQSVAPRQLHRWPPRRSGIVVRRRSYLALGTASGVRTDVAEGALAAGHVVGLGRKLTVAQPGRDLADARFGRLGFLARRDLARGQAGL